MVSAPYAIIPTRRDVTLVYPDDFANAGPMTAGTYVVEWRRRNPITGVISAIVGDPVIARDAFVIEERGAVGAS